MCMCQVVHPPQKQQQQKDMGLRTCLRPPPLRSPPLQSPPDKVPRTTSTSASASSVYPLDGDDMLPLRWKTGTCGVCEPVLGVKSSSATPTPVLRGSVRQAQEIAVKEEEANTVHSDPYIDADDGDVAGDLGDAAYEEEAEVYDVKSPSQSPLPSTPPQSRFDNMSVGELIGIFNDMMSTDPV